MIPLLLPKYSDVVTWYLQKLKKSIEYDIEIRGD